MASIESMISPFEEEYQRILNALKLKIEPNDNVLRAGKVQKSDIEILIRDVMRFQRKVEYIVNEVRKTITIKILDKNKKSSQKQDSSEGEASIFVRLEKIGALITKSLISNEQIETIKFSSGTTDGEYEYGTVIEATGVIKSLETAYDHIRKNDTKRARRYWYCAYSIFEKIYTDVIEFEEELKFIAVSLAYPLIKKLELRSELVINGFDEVDEKLQESEINAESGHWKDIVGRCRDAIERMIILLREKLLGEKSEKKFAADLNRLVEAGVLDDATQRLLVGVYGFLSLKGAHDYDTSKITVYDAERSLEETYSLLEMLLKIHKEKKGKIAKPL